MPGDKDSYDNLDIKAFVIEFKGEREEMQDFYILNESFNEKIWPTQSGLVDIIHKPNIRLYGIFDGHGGIKAADYVSKNFNTILAEKLSKMMAEDIHLNMKKIFIETFKKIDEDFLKEALKNKPPWNDGSTGTILIFIGDDTLYIANIGDSMAVLSRYNPVSQSYKAINLTENHSPTVYEERVRIQKYGGNVIFIIVACDGLWKAFSPEEAIEIVHHIIKEKLKLGMPLNKAYELACLSLSQKAAKSLCGDNITLMIIKIQQ
ncbi:integrin-linked kinase-associated serine/threonine phosphatase 2C-like isoform X6 [Gordionus sp. m RMFG-2023]|uniref:integrin-linked kinase-associated serine/threonine phosphatase 2C-like isoform X6 n=1 Tax=Gordionus sp. m RMFG-2023 TaxID=3053472 RepID=UPI0031FD1AFF